MPRHTKKRQGERPLVDPMAGPGDPTHRFHACAARHRPGTRLRLVNLAPAFTSVSLRTYALATLVGIIPGSFVFANLGQSLARISSTKDLVSLEIVGAFVLLGLFALVPVALKKFRSRGVS